MVLFLSSCALMSDSVNVSSHNTRSTGWPPQYGIIRELSESMLDGMFYSYKNGSTLQFIAFGLLWYVQCPFYGLWQQTENILFVFLYTCIWEIPSKRKCPNHWIVVGPFDIELFVKCRFYNLHKNHSMKWKKHSRYHFGGILREYLNVIGFFLRSSLN